MAKIDKGILKDFIDGETIHDNDLDQLVEIIRVANNDTDDKATYAKATVDTFTARVNDLEFVGNQRDVRVRETFTATEGQTLFTLTKGNYKVASSLLDVTIGNSLFYAGNGLTETSSSSFTLGTGVTAGTVVTATYYLANAPLGSTHGATHKKGGADELTLSDLNGYSELNTSITNQVSTVQTSLQTSINSINSEMDIVRRKDIANLTLTLDASKRVSAPDYLGTTGPNSLNMPLTQLSKNSLNALTIGTTNIGLDTVTGIVVGQEYTIYDDVSLERVTVTVIDTTNKIVTISTPLTKAYKANAKFVKSMIVSDVVDGFNIRGWIKPSGTTNNSTNQLDNSMSFTSATTYQPNNNNNIAVMDDGTVYISYKVADSGTSANSFNRLAKFTNGGVYNSSNWMQVLTGSGYGYNLNHAVFNLGGVYLGWFYSHGQNNTNISEEVYYLRIINTQTMEYVDNIIPIPIGSNMFDFCVSDDFKTVYIARNANGSASTNSFSLWTIQIQPDMTMKYSIDMSLGNSGNNYGLTDFKLAIVKGYLCLYYSYHASSNSTQSPSLSVLYRTVGGNGTWSKSDVLLSVQYSTYYYGMYEFDIVVDNSGNAWIAYQQLVNAGVNPTRFIYMNGSMPYQFSAALDIDAVVTLYTPRITETSDSIMVFASTGNGSTSMVTSDIVYVKINKTTKSITVAKTALGIAMQNYYPMASGSIYQNTTAFLVAKNKSLGLNDGFFLTYAGGDKSFYAKYNNTSVTYHPLAVADVRYTITNVKELTLYVTKSPTSNTSVNGYLNGVAPTKTETTSEVMLDWVLPNMLATAELRLEFTRSLTNVPNKFNKIVGGKSNV